MPRRVGKKKRKGESKRKSQEFVLEYFDGTLVQPTDLCRKNEFSHEGIDQENGVKQTGRSSHSMAPFQNEGEFQQAEMYMIYSTEIKTENEDFDETAASTDSWQKSNSQSPETTVVHTVCNNDASSDQDSDHDHRDEGKCDRTFSADLSSFYHDHCYSMITRGKTYASVYEGLKREIKNYFSKPIEGTFILNSSSPLIQILKVYATDKPGIKLSLTITKKFEAKLQIHQQRVADDHEIWIGQPKFFNTVSSIRDLLRRISQFSVCVGNPDREFQRLAEIDEIAAQAYKEGELGAFHLEKRYHSTIRHKSCRLLILYRSYSELIRCQVCSDFRGHLEKLNRMEVSKPSPLMTKDRLLSHINYQEQTINLQNLKIRDLQKELDELKGVSKR